MEYTPLLHEYAGFLMPAAITFVIASIVLYVVLPFTDFFEDITEWWNVAIASGTALLVAYGVGFFFALLPNTNSNLEAAKANIEAKYDVTASNLEKIKNDDTATVFTLYLVNNKDQSGNVATAIVLVNGEPSLIGFDSLQRQQP